MLARLMASPQASFKRANRGRQYDQATSVYRGSIRQTRGQLSNLLQTRLNPASVLACLKVGDTVALVKELSQAIRGKLLDFRGGLSGGK
jgi:hypothetical protein